MKSVKDNGHKELLALRRRVVRSHAMGRIGRADHDYLLQRLNEMEARIIEMTEYGEEETDA